LIEQNGKFKNKPVFCVGIKTKLLESHGFTVDVYLDYASELAEIITLIYNKESYTFERNLRKKRCRKH
jgi:uroporphyrinogen-III synthase